MTLLAALAAALAVWVLGLRPRRPLTPDGRAPRPAAPGHPTPDPAPRRRPGRAAGRRRPATRELVATLGAAGAAWTLAGPRAGPPAALLAAATVPHVLAALPTRARLDRDRALAGAVPLLADLVAACVAAGAPVDAAVTQAAAVVGGPLGDAAATAAAAVRLGVPPRVAWEPLLAPDHPPPVRALARALVRSTDSGAAPAGVLRAVADDARAATRSAGEAAARRAAVTAVLPLGLCFLPAFVLLGVVPLVASLLTGVL